MFRSKCKLNKSKVLLTYIFIYVHLSKMKILLLLRLVPTTITVLMYAELLKTTRNLVVEVFSYTTPMWTEYTAWVWYESNVVTWERCSYSMMNSTHFSLNLLLVDTSSIRKGYFLASSLQLAPGSFSRINAMNCSSVLCV